MNIERKLEMFAKTCEDDAKQKRQDMQALIDHRLKDALEKIKQKALEDAEKKLELELYRLKQAQKREIANHKNKNRKKIILKRGELLETLTCEIKEALEEYTSSDEYREWLDKNIIRELRVSPGATVVLRPADYEYLELMGTTASNQVALGGYKLISADKKTAIDKTFEMRLDIEMDNFQGFIAMF